MNVQEILEDADLLAPNSFPVSRKVGWVNQVQKQLYREIPAPFKSAPQDIQEGQLTYVPRFPIEYHELFVFGIAKRMAERAQDFKLASELEARYQNLLREAIKYTAPKLTKVTKTRGWV